MSKALDERRVDLQEKMADLINTAKAEKRELTSAEAEEFSNYETEIKNIDETNEREERNMNTNTERTEIEIRESKQFVDYVRGVLENRADSNLTAGSNGAIIPTTVAKKIVRTAYDMSAILHHATKYNTKGNLSIPVYGADGSTDVTMTLLSASSLPIKPLPVLPAPITVMLI